MSKKTRKTADRQTLEEAKRYLRNRSDLNEHLAQILTSRPAQVLPHNTQPVDNQPGPGPISLSLSSLYCDEVLELPSSPPVSNQKQSPISPYSKAEVRAKNAGVTLPHNWRDPAWYTPEELQAKIEVVEEYNKRQLGKADKASKKRLFK